jgi:hypothetical protein
VAEVQVKQGLVTEKVVQTTGCSLEEKEKEKEKETEA